MQCPRCRGVMATEQFESPGGNSVPWTYDGWRCLYCGEVIDSLILQNRTRFHREMEEHAGAGPAGGRGRR